MIIRRYTLCRAGVHCDNRQLLLVILSDERSEESKDPYTRNDFSQLVVTSGFALGAPGSRPSFGP